MLVRLIYIVLAGCPQTCDAIISFIALQVVKARKNLMTLAYGIVFAFSYTLGYQRVKAYDLHSSVESSLVVRIIAVFIGILIQSITNVDYYTIR